MRRALGFALVVAAMYFAVGAQAQKIETDRGNCRERQPTVDGAIFKHGTSCSEARRVMRRWLRVCPRDSGSFCRVGPKRERWECYSSPAPDLPFGSWYVHCQPLRELAYVGFTFEELPGGQP